MIDRREFMQLNRMKQFGGTGPRASGKSFRCLLNAAHATSVGERVTLWCYNSSIAREYQRQFMDMFGRWGFEKTTPNLVRHRHSEGFVLFYGLPRRYDEYTNKVRGNDTMDIFDI